MYQVPCTFIYFPHFRTECLDNVIHLKTWERLYLVSMLVKNMIMVFWHDSCCSWAKVVPWCHPSPAALSWYLFQDNDVKQNCYRLLNFQFLRWKH
jgi:hypothetical protein